MSSKGSKRRQRRINTYEEEPEKKLIVEDSVEQSDDSKSNISTDTDKLDKVALIKNENGGVELQNATAKDADTTIQNGKDTNAEKENAETKTTVEETPNSQTETEITNSQNYQDTDESDMHKLIIEDAGSDIEPLVIDSEDTELAFPPETCSDRSSEIEKSPILSRPKTRRSQSRNLPTPKTPKPSDFNGDAECKSEVRVNIARLSTAPEVIVTPPTEDDEKSDATESVFYEAMMHELPEESVDDSEAEDDLANASVFVNYTGNDTRNMDFTTTSAMDDGPSFIETTKDMSYGETLRCISGRKGFRSHFDSSYRPRMYKSTVDVTSNDMADGVKKFVPLTPAPSSGMKRRLSRDSPEKFKRVKTDGDAHGLLSYIASPFKSKLGHTEIPSSTPKLTSFKYTPHHGATVIDEVSKLDLELREPPNTEPKKWCSIM